MKLGWNERSSYGGREEHSLVSRVGSAFVCSTHETWWGEGHNTPRYHGVIYGGARHFRSKEYYSTFEEARLWCEKEIENCILSIFEKNLPSWDIEEVKKLVYDRVKALDAAC